MANPVLHSDLRHVAVISIDETRYAKTMQNLQLIAESCQFVRFGVNGKNLQRQRFPRARGLTRGQIGCFLSHVAAWKHQVKHGLQYMFVIEDDVDWRPTPDAVAHVNTVWTEYKQYRAENFLAKDLYFWTRHPAHAERLHPISEHIHRAGQSYGLFGYVMPLATAKFLLTRPRIQNVHKALDVQLDEMNSNNLVRFYAANRMLFSWRREERSDTTLIR